LTKCIVWAPISVTELATLKILPPQISSHTCFFYQEWLVYHRCTLEPLVAKIVMYMMPYSSEAVLYVNKKLYSLYKYLSKYI
jgi:hypothetical protein